MEETKRQDERSIRQEEVRDLENKIILQNSTNANVVSDNTVTEPSDNTSAENKEADERIYLQILKNIAKGVEENRTLVDVQEKELKTLQHTLDGKIEDERQRRKKFLDFRDKTLSKHSNSNAKLLLELKEKEIATLSEIERARMLFLKTKLKVKKLEMKSKENKDYSSGVDDIGFEQMKASFEEKKQKNIDREKDIVEYKSMRQKYIDEFKSEQTRLDEMRETLREKREKIKEMDEIIKKRQRNKDIMKKKMQQLLTMQEVAKNAADSHDLVKMNHLKSEKEINMLKVEIQDLKEKYALTIRV